tara:strand:+ start:213 stop:785 length:573 start_codon:yes stop_codon:yes gene_type:complete
MEMLMGGFKNFNISKFMSTNPPSNYSFDTSQEIKELVKIPLNKRFVEEKDDIKSYFKKIGDRLGVEFYPESIAEDLIEQSAPIIMKLKNHYNRPRPKVLAKKMGIKLNDIEMASMKTPSYPSGHSVQGILIGNILATMFPLSAEEFVKAGKDISYSRNIARAHYKSDSKFGEAIGLELYKHLKQNNNGKF